MTLKRKMQLCREFGFKVVFSDVCASSIRLPGVFSRWKDRVILDWFRRNYGQVIETYRQKDSQPEVQSCAPLPVWSMWWQGTGSAPEIVRLCLESTHRHCGSHPFRVITQENYGEYISLPEYIFARFNTGNMKPAHFSDIVRMYLLANYGGLWLDATVFTAADIPEEIFASEYYTARHELDPLDRNVSMQRWTTYLQAGRKGNLLCRFVLDIMLEYWKRQDTFIDYVMTDYFIALAYEELPGCRAVLDAVPFNNAHIEGLRPLLNEEWNAEVYDALVRDTQFFKLTYKHQYMKEVRGRKTFYSRVLGC